MSRSAVNFLLDVALVVSFLSVLWTQTAQRWLFPPASDSAGWRLWGLSYDQWAWLAFVLLFAFALMILVHLMLHWRWVCGYVAHRIGRSASTAAGGSHETLIGVAILVGVLHVLGALYLIAALTIERPREPARPAPGSSKRVAPVIGDESAVVSRWHSLHRSR